MTTPTNFTAASRAQIEQVVRQARAERAEVIRAAAHDFAVAIKRAFASFRNQAPRPAA